MDAHLAQVSNRPSRLAALLSGLGLVLLGASCVSQIQHEEVLDELKFYQRSNQDLESYQGKLEAENERLAGELAIRSGEPIEAGTTRVIDERLQELSEIMAGLGNAPGDVDVLPVEGGYGLRLSDSILFDSGSAALKDEGRALLVKMAGEIKTHSFNRIWVRGHSDSDPVVRAATKKLYPHGNLQLSAARAMEVAVVLSGEGGIAMNQFVVAGFGSSEPIASNKDAESKRKNRRVEIFVIEEAPAGN